MKTTITYITGFIFISITLLCIVALDIFFFKRMTEYTAHIMFAFLGLGLLFLVLNREKMMMVSFFCTAVLAIFLKGASHEGLIYPQLNTISNVKIAHINLSNLNNDFSAVIQLMENESPDVITFQEYTPEWTNILKDNVQINFPFSRYEVRIDPFGMAIFSKFKMNNQEVDYFYKIPNLNFDIEIANQHYNIVLSYVLPPVLNHLDQTTQNHLSFVGEEILNEKPSILVGDFNMVYWSNEIRQFRDIYHLKNSRKNYTPSNLTVPPYDHMFFDEELECTSFKEALNEKGEHIGILGVFEYTDENVEKSKSLGLFTQ